MKKLHGLICDHCHTYSPTWHIPPGWHVVRDAHLCSDTCLTAHTNP